MGNSFRARVPFALAVCCCVLTSGVLAQAAGGSAEQPELYATLPVATHEAPAQLETVIVIGEGETPYVAPYGSGATKTATPPLETPQSVTTITRAQLEDQGVQTLQDALRYVAGINADAYGIDSRTDGALVRGSDFTEYLDGLRRQFDYYNNTRVDPYVVDAVDIVRGPASVLYGQGTVGGIVAMRSKLPRRESAHELRIEYGSYDRRQIALDSTGRISGDGSLQYRLVALGRESDMQVDYVQDDRWLVQPSLAFESASLRWTLLGNFQRDFSGSTTAFLPWEGTVLPNPNGRIPTNRFVSETPFDRYDTYQNAGTSLLEWRITPSLSFHQNLRYSRSGADYRSMYPNIYFNPYKLNDPTDPYIDPQRRRVGRIAIIQDGDVDALTSDHQLQWRSETFGVEHLVLGGVEFNDVTLDTRRSGLDYASILLQIPFDLYSPQYGQPFIYPSATAQPEQKLRQTGAYLQDQLKFERLVVLLSGRRDWSTSAVAGSADDQDAQTSWRTGLMYRFDMGLAPYASWSESFQPTAGTDADGAAFKPLLGKQLEGGIKYQPNPALLFTAALFDMKEQNRLVAGPNPQYQVQVDAKTRGYELEARGTIAGHLDLIGSYTHLDASADDQGINENLAGVADDMGSAWLNWHVPFGERSRVSVGGGARYIGARHDESGAVELPSVTLIDAMLALDLGPVRLAVNGSNLADKAYVATCLKRGDCFYGPRRVVGGSLAYRF